MREHKCRKCGKNFIPTYDWVYKDDRGIYCSYPCYNHREVCERKRKQSMPVELYAMDGKTLLKTFDNAVDAANITQHNLDRVRKACRDGTPFAGFIWKYKGR